VTVVLDDTVCTDSADEASSTTSLMTSQLGTDIANALYSVISDRQRRRCRPRMAAGTSFSDCIRAGAVGPVFSYTAINAVLCFVNNGLAAKTQHRACASVSRSFRITKSTFANFVPKFNLCPTGRLSCRAGAQ